jgi:hypothetical protein
VLDRARRAESPSNDDLVRTRTLKIARIVPNRPHDDNLGTQRWKETGAAILDR